MKSEKIKSDFHINNHCYSKDENLINFCLDTKHS